jgi:hypothetical protein
LAKSKEEKFKETLNLKQRKSKRLYLVETSENAPFKVGMLVIMKNLKKSLKKSIMDYDFLGPFKIKMMHSNGKVDLLIQ